MSISILIVEDEALVRLVLVEEINELGWEITDASTVDEALAMLKSGSHFDVVLTDVNTPGNTNGMELAAFLRTTAPGVRIAIMSGMPANEGRHLLCDLYLDKPTRDVGPKLLVLMTAPTNQGVANQVADGEYLPKDHTGAVAIEQVGEEWIVQLMEDGQTHERRFTTRAHAESYADGQKIRLGL